MDYPALHIGQAQSANIVVNDSAGQPVPGATVIMTIEAANYSETHHFRLTDSNGRSRLAIPLPPVTTSQTFTVTVRVQDSYGRWDGGSASFEVYP